MLNENQIRAIESRSRDILVSASAGTGKTTVLVKRIVRCIKTDGLDMSRLVAVTFSRAAAAELKEKIRKGISDEITELSGRVGTDGQAEADIRKLRAQRERLGLATISTIHSLCHRLVNSYFDRLGVPPRLKILDENENKILRKNVASRVDEFYQLGLYGELDMKGLAAFEDVLSPEGENPDRYVATLYENIKLSASGMDGFRECVKEYEKAVRDGFGSTSWAEKIRNGFVQDLKYWETVFSQACAQCDRGGYEKHREVFAADLKFAEEAAGFAEKGDFAALRVLTETFIKSGRKDMTRAKEGEGEDPELSFYKRLRADKWNRRVFLGSLLESIPDMKRHDSLAQACLDSAKSGYEFMTRFCESYRDEKLRRSLTDFDDLEEMACSLLWDSEKGGPTETAYDFAKKIDALYIDEYQDVNARQDRIFAALRAAHGENGKPERFMVGDFKQSIYGFRGSDPGIFAAYLNSPPEGMEIIRLNENYRCDRSVIKYVNRVSGTLFRLQGLNMPYTDGDDLVAGKPPELDAGIEVQTRFPAPADKSGGEKIAPVARRARAVAQYVRELIESGEKPEDICVLTRYTGGFNELISALDGEGVQAQARGDDLLSAPEVTFAVCLLTALDNPSNDIALAGTLKSPVFGFTLQDLAYIMRHGQGKTLYEALKIYAGETGDEKSGAFLEKFGKWRSLTGLPADRLLWYLYCDTGMMAYAGQELPGERKNSEKKKRLLSLHRMAVEFENGGAHGLDSFVAHLKGVIGESGRLKADEDSAKGAVKIMTMHASKGLEFDNVIIAETGAGFKYGKKTEKKINFSFTEGEGFIFKIDDGDFTGVSTIPCLAADRADEMKGAGEEMRLLYVAMTRARKRLTLFCEKPDDGTQGDSLRYLKGQALTNRVVKSNSFASWLSMFATKTVVQEESPAAPAEKPCGAVADPELVEKLKERLSFRYGSEAVSLPAKLSVSRLSPDILDGNDLSTDLGETVYAPRDPDFLAGTPLSGTDVGTATHMFMQFCDLKALREKGARQELGRLVGERFLSPESAGLVRLRQADAFGKSAECGKILSSGFVRRELRFNVALDASKFTADPALAERLKGQNLLVQGVMDCLYENPDGSITVLDYKTDAMPYTLKDSRAEFEKALIARHSAQLGYYRAAAEIITGKKVGRCVIWSFALGKAVEV